MRLTVLTAVLLAVAVPVLADEGGPWELRIGGLSRHLRNDAQLNDSNIGLGLQYSFSWELGLDGGGYRNSSNGWSNYAFVRYEPVSLGPARLGILAGIVTGYRRHNYGGIVPGAIPAATFALGRLDATVIVIPNVLGTEGVVSILLGWRL